MFALFRNGTPIIKPQRHWWPCLIAAYDRGLITQASNNNFVLSPFCEIKELEPSEVTVRRERDEEWR
jgi:hypothetical protein